MKPLIRRTAQVLVLVLVGSPLTAGNPPSAGAPADGTTPGEAAAVDLRETTHLSFGRLLTDDLRFVATSPGRLRLRGWTSAALAVGGLFALMRSENGDVDVETQEGSSTERFVSNVFEPFGSEGALAVLGGFLLAGTAGHREHAKEVAADGAISSLIAAGLITPALKLIAGRSRPHQSADATDFHPFGGHASFPSGHTTEAFAVASVIAAHYDSHWADFAAYGTASLVGYARVLHDRHYASDVLAGALIGTLVGRTVVRHNRHLRGERFVLEPLVDPRGGVGLSLRLRLSKNSPGALASAH